jgi:hypothetical protein
MRILGVEREHLNSALTGFRVEQQDRGQVAVGIEPAIGRVRLIGQPAKRGRPSRRNVVGEPRHGTADETMVLLVRNVHGAKQPPVERIVVRVEKAVMEIPVDVVGQRDDKTRVVTFLV